MRLATIRTDGGTRAGRVDGDAVSLLPFDDVGELLSSGADWAQRAAAGGGEDVALSGVSLAPVVPRPEKIVCVGLNYRAHAAEAKLDLPDYPILFAKYTRSLIGAGDDLVLPGNSDKVDWEAELGLVIGTEVRHADLATAEAAIAGYTVINDVSMRDWQRRTSQFLQGKTFERSTPAGPYLVTPDELEDPRRLHLTCTVDDEVMQDAFTDDLVFSPAEVVSYISAIITLVPGDLIATGTPGGVGGARRPQVFLVPGQTMRTKIDGVGELVNRCVAEPAPEPEPESVR
jgi:acylpyruvate hydrolase